MLRNFYISFIYLFIAAHFSSLQGGITGTLSGKIIDKETGNILPGAFIVVEGTTMGAMADKNGFYMIQNLPAGFYNVSVSMIGYYKLTVKNVQINVDLNTELNFDLSAKVLPLDEVVVTEKKKLIQSEITSSTYFISGAEINDRLPIDSYLDAVALLPGVVDNHIRGGRETDVLYMLDGLPIQGALSREISSYFPNSSIVEMMVQTGGFSAEYGQATSGVVNVISKDGRNKVEGSLKFYSDFFDTGLTGSDNTRRLELNVGGPMTIGLGGPLINAKYFISADLNLSDTAHREKLQEAFNSPIFTNYNMNSKLSFDIARNTILTFQGLLSNWKWRQFDSQWELNPLGLAENKHYSHRLSASLTHTFSSKFFTSFRVANYSYKRLILGEIAEDPPNLIFEDPTNPFSQILSGTQPWEEETRENVDVLKLDIVGQVSANHQLKTGFDFQNYHLDSENIQFRAIPTRGQTNTITFNRSQNNFSYTPNFFAFYIQDKIEFKGVTANLGIRYDVFAPEISIEELPQAFKQIRLRLNAPIADTNSETHTPISPRLGISLPLSDNERLHVNYGWYYQMPPLYYLYTNAEHNVNSYFPFIGNTELVPIKTVSTEFSYKRVVSDDLLFVFTGFTKKFNNLIDTQTFLLADSLIDTELSNVGFSRYTSSAFGRASGFEVTLQKRFTNELSGRVSYTYMKANGTSSTAEDGFNNVILGTPASEGTQFPLSWDQRHSIILDAGYNARKLKINLLYRLFSPLPVTTANSETPNDTRLSWRNILDIKIRLNTQNILGGHFNPFFEIRNLFDEKNIVNQPDNTGIKAYRLFDPINSDQGRRLRVGMTLDF